MHFVILQLLSVMNVVSVQSLNPKWTDDTLPELLVGVGSVHRLRMQYLMLAVVDHDVGSEDDYIGMLAALDH